MEHSFLIALGVGVLLGIGSILVALIMEEVGNIGGGDDDLFA